LPGASQQINLPLFLQTLTWVDFRNGYDETGISNLRRTVDAASNRPTPPNAPTPTTATKSEAFRSSLKSASDFGRPWFWIFLAGLLLPLAFLISGLGPPWNGSHVWQRVASIYCLTVVFQLLAAIAAIYLAGLRSNDLRRRFAMVILFGVVSFVVYVVQYSLFTEEQPNMGHRLTIGWKFSQEFSSVMAAENWNISQTKEAFGYRSSEIYQPWSIWASYFSLLFSWLTFFASIAACIGFFLKNSIALLQGDRLGDDRSLILLGLPQSINQLFYQADIHTIGDICVLREEQLGTTLRGNQTDIMAVKQSLNKFGLEVYKR
jgi:hypothetical protein